MNKKDTSQICVSRYELQTYLWSKLTPTQEEQLVFNQLFKQYDAFHPFKSVIPAFQKLTNKQKNEQALPEWMIQAEVTKIYEEQQFIKYIQTDIDAVKHALSYSCSNGIAEGQVKSVQGSQATNVWAS